MDERIYSTYIVASRSHTLYIGVTGNLLKRIFEHKRRTHEGFSGNTTAIGLFGLRASLALKARLHVKNS